MHTLDVDVEIVYLMECLRFQDQLLQQTYEFWSFSVKMIDD